MKALLIYHGCLDKLGGAQRVVRNIADMYAKYSERVFLIYDCGSFYFKKRGKNMLISLPSLSFRGISFFPFPYSFRLIVRLLKSSNVVHLFFSETFLQLIIAFYARVFRKVVISSHLALYSYLFHHSIFVRLVAPILIFFKLLIASLSDFVYTPLFYDAILLKLNPLVKAKVVFIPHGVHSIVSKDSSSFKSNSSSKENKMRLMFLGRFTKDKGAFVLLDALFLLINDGLPVELLIVGPRPTIIESLYAYYRRYPNRFRRIIKAIKIMSDVKENEKFGLISSVHCGIIPSLSDAVEAFSIALSEFNILSRCVIASRVGALKYRIQLTDSGILVKPRNPKSLANAIKYIWLSLQKNNSAYTTSRMPDTITIDEEAERWRYFLSLVKLLVKFKGVENNERRS